MRPYHYITRIMEDRDRLEHGVIMSGTGFIETDRVRSVLYNQLHKAIKFTLPEGGKILDIGISESISVISEFCKLPYPVIAIEYYQPYEEHDPKTRIGRIGRDVEARERVILCSEMPNNALMVTLFIKSHGRGISVWAPFDGSVLYYPKEHNGHVVPNFMSKEFFSAEIQQNVISNYSDEFPVIGNLLAALSCKNVYESLSLAPRHMNNKRKKKKKAPIYEYKFLEINTEKLSAEPRTEKGFHASPRIHLRRGHIRRLQDGDRIWVNAAIVGRKNGTGVLHKDYGVLKQ